MQTLEKPITWSYSGMSLFKQCPKKYHHLRILKDFKDKETEALLYGSAVHKAAEDYITEKEPIPPQYKYMETYMSYIDAYEGDKLAEYKMAIRLDGTPCGFDDPDAWWRGIADLIVFNGELCRVIDYKTGKSARFADTVQLDLLALATFAHFPQVQVIKSALIFVVANELIKRKYHRDSSVARLMKEAQDSYVPLREAYSSDVWNPKPNFTCAKYCPVTSCLHNGRN
jgi:hypothetical protein